MQWLTGGPCGSPARVVGGQLHNCSTPASEDVLRALQLARTRDTAATVGSRREGRGPRHAAETTRSQFPKYTRTEGNSPVHLSVRNSSGRYPGRSGHGWAFKDSDAGGSRGRRQDAPGEAKSLVARFRRIPLGKGQLQQPDSQKHGVVMVDQATGSDAECLATAPSPNSSACATVQGGFNAALRWGLNPGIVGMAPGFYGESHCGAVVQSSGPLGLISVPLATDVVGDTPAAGSVVIDCGNASRALNVTAPSFTLRGITIQNCKAEPPGGTDYSTSPANAEANAEANAGDYDGGALRMTLVHSFDVAPLLDVKQCSFINTYSASRGGAVSIAYKGDDSKTTASPAARPQIHVDADFHFTSSENQGGAVALIATNAANMEVSIAGKSVESRLTNDNLDRNSDGGVLSIHYVGEASNVVTSIAMEIKYAMSVSSGPVSVLYHDAADNVSTIVRLNSTNTSCLSGFGGALKVQFMGDVSNSTVVVDSNARHAWAGVGEMFYGFGGAVAISAMANASNLNISLSLVARDTHAINDGGAAYVGFGGLATENVNVAVDLDLIDTSATGTGGKGGAVCVEFLGLSANATTINVTGKIMSATSEQGYSAGFALTADSVIDMLDVFVDLVTSTTNAAGGAGGAACYFFNDDVAGVVLHGRLNVTDSSSATAGGAMAVFFGGKASHSKIDMNLTTATTRTGNPAFEDAKYGGAVFIEFEKKTENVSTYLSVDSLDSAATGSGGSIFVAFGDDAVGTTTTLVGNFTAIASGASGGAISIIYFGNVSSSELHLAATADDVHTGLLPGNFKSGGVVSVLFVADVTDTAITADVVATASSAAGCGGAVDMVFETNVQRSTVSLTTNVSNVESSDHGGTASLDFQGKAAHSNVSVSTIALSTKAKFGGAVSVRMASSAFTNVEISADVAATVAHSNGGALYVSSNNENGTVYAIRANVSNASAVTSGGAVYVSQSNQIRSMLEVKGHVSGSTAHGGYGGAMNLHINGTSVDSGSYIYMTTRNTRAAGDGGAIEVCSNHSTSTNATVRIGGDWDDSVAGESGGAVAVNMMAPSNADVTIFGNARGTTATRGSGGAVAFSCTDCSDHPFRFSIRNATVTNTSAAAAGGALSITTIGNASDANITISGLHAANTSSAGSGGAVAVVAAGGIFKRAKLEFIDCQFSFATSWQTGGAISIFSSAFRAESVAASRRLLSNSSNGTYVPAGFFDNSSIMVWNSSFHATKAEEAGALGGAVYLFSAESDEMVESTLVEIDSSSSFSGCEAGLSGGAIYMQGPFRASVGVYRNVTGTAFTKTLFENCRVVNGKGGCIDASSMRRNVLLGSRNTGTLYIEHANFSSCDASLEGGTIHASGTALHLTNNSHMSFRRHGGHNQPMAPPLSAIINLSPQKPLGVFLNNEGQGTFDDGGGDMHCEPGEALVTSRIQYIDHAVPSIASTVNESPANVSESTKALLFYTDIKCVPCPPNTYSLQSGNRTHPSIECFACTDGMLCPGGKDVFARGFRWIEETREGSATLLRARSCPRCTGSSDVKLDAAILWPPAALIPDGSGGASSPSRSDAGPMVPFPFSAQNRCQEGRMQPTDENSNVLCGQCERNSTHTFVETVQLECVECSVTNWRKVMLFAVFIVVVVAIFFAWVTHSQRPFAHLKMIIYYLQMSSVLLSVRLASQPATRRANGGIGLLPYIYIMEFTQVFCFGPLTEIQSRWLSLLTPVAYFAALGMLAALSLLWRRCLTGTFKSAKKIGAKQWSTLDANDESLDSDSFLTADSSSSDDSDSRLLLAALARRRAPPRIDPLYRGVGITAYYLTLYAYHTFTRNSLELLSCEHVDGHHVLVAHPGVDCSSAEYLQLKAAAAIIFAAVSVGFPICLLVTFYRKRDLPSSDPWLNAFGVAIYGHYKPRFQWWWEGQQFLRRLVVLAVVTLMARFDGQQDAQCMVVGVIFLLIFVSQVWASPHETARKDKQWWHIYVNANAVENCTHLLLTLMAFGGVLSDLSQKKYFAANKAVLVALVIRMVVDFATADDGVVSKIVSLYFKKKGNQSDHAPSGALQQQRINHFANPSFQTYAVDSNSSSDDELLVMAARPGGGGQYGEVHA